MRKPTMALISTWQELCGVAHYSWFLKRALDPYFDIEVYPIPRQIILANTNGQEVKEGDDLIDSICKELPQFDVTNIQFEPGLYGPSIDIMSRRACRVVNASKAISMSFHSVWRDRPRSVLSTLAGNRHLGLLRGGYATFRRHQTDRQWENFYRTVSQHSKKHRVGLIAHTQRDVRFLRNCMPGPEILNNPLTYMDEDYLASLPDIAAKSSLPRLLPPRKAETRYLGVFGFFNEYKGFDTAIRALQFLPDEYELLVFSSIHESLVGHAPTQAFLNRIVDMVSSTSQMRGRRPLSEKVHFMGCVSDEDVLLGMMLCDAVLLPYSSVVHTASGPASQAIELNRKLFTSRTTQFIELSKYFPDNFELCDGPNPHEYAQKIVRLTQDREERTVAGMRWVVFPRKERQYTIVETAQNYIRAAGLPSPPTLVRSKDARSLPHEATRIDASRNPIKP